MKRLLKILVLCTFLSFGSYKAYRMWESRTDGFAIEKIHSTAPDDPAYAVETTANQRDAVNAILNQPFYYLGHGFQTYVFQSKDKKYVLKFVRYQRLRFSRFANALPQIPPISIYRAHKEVEFAERKHALFNGYKIGVQKAPEETAILYVHLTKTKAQHGTVIIYDKAGQQYAVRLDDVEFIVQKRANQLKGTITQLMDAKRVDEAKTRIDQIFTLLLTCAKKGVCDIDSALIRKNNIGFLDDKAIYIDSGKIVFFEEVCLKKRFRYDIKRLHQLHKWLAASYPELAVYLVTREYEILHTL